MIAPALALCLAAAGPPDGDVARAEPSRQEVRLGEPFDHALALRHAPEERVELVPPPDLSPFALRSSACRTIAGERNAITVCTLSLQLLDLGERELPAFSLRVTGPGGERVVAAAGASVRGVGGEGPRDEPLRRPAAPPVLVPSWRLLGWAAAAGAAALLSWLLWRALRRRAPPAAVLSPWERLSRRVSEILALDLPRRGFAREHVLRLSGAVREYLAGADPRAALDLTTQELLGELEARPAPGVDGAALGRLLGAADLVKFARADPGPAECEAAAAFARELLERTRPPPAAAGPGKEAA